MELNRATITGQAFPQATDGYEREAVDRHLVAIADALEARAPDSVGAEAAEQMRSIVEGAQNSAQALRDAAQREAEEVREAARSEAEAVRERAHSESGDQVAGARAAVKGILERVEALGLGIEDSRRHVTEAAEEMARRLSADSEPLVGTLRERARALGSELDLIGSGLAGRVVEAAAEAAPPAPAAQTAPAPPPETGTGLSIADVEDAAQTLDGAAPATAEQPLAPAPSEPAPTPPAEASAPGTERARLVALNMAVSGTPRAEAERHLREELGVEDPSAILDEVYARAHREV